MGNDHRNDTKVKRVRRTHTKFTTIKKRQRKQLKKKSVSKCKNNHFFKRKQLIRYFVRYKRHLKMNTDPTSEHSNSDKRWQQEDETAYWKSRAISLEYENKMLHKHIKRMYINITHNNQQFAPDAQENGVENQENYEDVNPKSNEKKKSEDLEDEEQSKPPSEQNNKKEEEKMKLLYGSAWRTIIGMETAVQLKYDLVVDENKSQYWPVIPIVL